MYLRSFKKAKEASCMAGALMNNGGNAGAKVLLVEDERICQMLIGTAINEVGYEFDLVENGLTALKMIKDNQYKLVIMNVGLPDITGVQVTYLVRVGSVARKDIPIVALTTQVDEEVKEQCFNAGMNGVFAKPIAAEDLKELIDIYAK